MVKIWILDISSQLLGLNQLLTESIIGYLSVTQADLMIGMVFGDQSSLPADISHNLKITGMQHVVSASGTNVGLILQPVIYFCRLFSVLSRLRYLVVMTVIWSYLIMTGGNPPIVRAVIMATYKLSCEASRRQYQPGFALVLAGLIMLIINPAYLGHLSFQLSIGASIGIIFLLPILSKKSEHNLVANLDFLSAHPDYRLTKSITQILVDSFYCTLAAQLAITPILFLHHLPVSLISLISNSLLLWLVPLITIFGLAAMILASLAQVGFWPVWFTLAPLLVILRCLIDLFTNSLSFWGRWEAGVVTLPQSWWLAIGWWGSLVVWAWTRRGQR